MTTTENSLPRWSVRYDVTRPHGFGDLISILGWHLKTHDDAERLLGPYNARQRSSKFPYAVPTLEFLKSGIKQGGMNDLSYRAYLNSLVRFCEKTKGTRGLPLAHPSTLHSIQLPEGSFNLKNGKTPQTSILEIAGVEEPVIIQGVPREVRFVIVRPKLSKLGTASATKWEALFFKQNLGYIPDWVDSDLNPRWAGKL